MDWFREVLVRKNEEEDSSTYLMDWSGVDLRMETHTLASRLQTNTPRGSLPRTIILRVIPL